MRKGIIIASIFVAGVATLLFAADAADPARPHAPFELLGVGPEMAQDRGVAWVRAFSEIVKAAISELGIIAAAVLLLVQNIKNGRTIEETKAHLDQRLDNQAKRINDVAIAAAPGAAPVVEVSEPTLVTPAPQ